MTDIWKEFADAMSEETVAGFFEKTPAGIKIREQTGLSSAELSRCDRERRIVKVKNKNNLSKTMVCRIVDFQIPHKDIPYEDLRLEVEHQDGKREEICWDRIVK